MRFMGFLTISALVAATTLSGPAFARDKAEGWRNWTERAERIETALLSTDSRQLDSACSGVTGTVVSHGFQFPYWAQSLIQVCTVTQAAYHGSLERKRSTRICKDLTSVSRIIGKAVDTPESGNAAAVAQRLSTDMMLIREQVCQKVDGKVRD